MDAGDPLERLSRMPIRSWHYKAEDDNIGHLGPTAQDFYAAFRLGESDNAIGTVREPRANRGDQRIRSGRKP